MSEQTFQDLSLAAEFPPATREQWLQLVEGVLKGAPFDPTLVGRTYDGLAIEPLYGRDPAARPVTARSAGAPWQVIQRVDHPDPAVANTEVLHDLENGATGLSLVWAGSAGAHGYGLPASEGTLARALNGVFLDAGVAIDIDRGAQANDIPPHIAALVHARGIAPASVDIRFGFDPIGALAASGQSPWRWADAGSRLANIVGELAGQGFRGPFAVADGRIIHDAGGSQVQELGYALAVAVAYLRALETGGVALDQARGMIYFRLAADADQYLTVAKFRALRKLWARVEEACGLAPEPAFVAAETAWRMMTKRDPWVNILRATIAVLSAGLGGADAITVLPHTAALGLPDRFARRLARNTQLILLEESNLAKVADPAAGAGGIEDLTAKLCAATWSLFQEIEAAGGVSAALEQSLIQKKVATVRAAREQAVARRKDALTGTSEFPDIFEAPVSVLDVAPPASPAPPPAAVTIEPLPCTRLAQPFEVLRDASDRMLSTTGSRPKVFLANLGKLSEFSARATFAMNFFAAGGIEAVRNDGFVSNEQMAAAFKASGANLACLCSSDEIYAVEAVNAAQALAAAGAKHIYLAGRPRALEATLRAAGVQSFVYVGCDVLATLKAAHDTIGLSN
jgi:methylmalonyl-CoA mutase